jgi:hypothetical protein
MIHNVVVYEEKGVGGQDLHGFKLTICMRTQISNSLEKRKKKKVCNVRTNIYCDRFSMKHMLICESGHKVIPLLKSDFQTYAPKMFKYTFDDLIDYYLYEIIIWSIHACFKFKTYTSKLHRRK